MLKAKTVHKHKVTPMVLYCDNDSRFKSRSGAFSALARLAVADGKWKEALPLYKFAIADAEEAFGADSTIVGLLLEEISGVYFHLGEQALCRMYRRRAKCLQ